MNTIFRVAAGGMLLWLTACGGGGGGGGDSDAVALTTKDDALRELAISAVEVAGLLEAATDINSPGGGGSAPPPQTPVETHFQNRVQPNLEFCRNCHVPGGVADVEGGRRLTLSFSPSEDASRLRAAWDQLGRGVESSPVLRYAAGQEVHTGGAPWPAGSAPYDNMRILLSCWENPAGCDAQLQQAKSSRSTASRAKAAENCGSGSSVEVDDEELHTFRFFENRQVDADYRRRTDTRCVVTGNTTRETFNGLTEFGSTGTTNDGARFAYLRDGVDGGAYEQLYEEFDQGQLVYSETDRRFGSVEARDTDEALDLRAVYSLRYRNSAGGFIDLDIGSSLAPFRVREDGDGLRFDGAYGYATNECSGGRVTVSTPAGLSRSSESDGFDAGQLKFVSGDQTAIFAFREDGRAQLTLNGTNREVSAAEVAQAIASEPCQ